MDGIDRLNSMSTFTRWVSEALSNVGPRAFESHRPSLEGLALVSSTEMGEGVEGFEMPDVPFRGIEASPLND